MLRILLILLKGSNWEISKKNIWEHNLNDALVNALLPNCSWAVGYIPAQIRKVAIECIFVVYQVKSYFVCLCCVYIERRQLFFHKNLIKRTNWLRQVLESNIDDMDPFVRECCVKSLYFVLEHAHDRLKMIDDEFMATLAQAIIDRLDDGHDNIRIATCHTLQMLLRCFDKEINGKRYRTVVATAFIHLDDSNKCVQVTF
ncbi:hypothetical protein RFI_11543 [Reticulomyxa filosa]|uniref:Uncharacterized protein n=1 Tax=Reticulomyxa filosa TaxID=46433 RepID=X6NHV1_RETFI|nr:hypothetical protein RFI_11543 [Reticulomyxa filosa]|eukprot:ETO25591.1 hypothetical protein RFI_11543 [Reticulomyxa filosa]